MQLNKTLTVQKEEESSSLTNQELLFVRRKDIDPYSFIAHIPIQFERKHHY